MSPHADKYHFIHLSSQTCHRPVCMCVHAHTQQPPALFPQAQIQSRHPQLTWECNTIWRGPLVMQVSLEKESVTNVKDSSTTVNGARSQRRNWEAKVGPPYQFHLRRGNPGRILLEGGICPSIWKCMSPDLIVVHSPMPSVNGYYSAETQVVAVCISSSLLLPILRICWKILPKKKRLSAFESLPVKSSITPSHYQVPGAVPALYKI